ncbi:hypothetical protein [Thalassospira sp.]|uniref:hypothetical protein n=1 Tax=Thalassospira sp. TaxID=1912094 RepID=UPI0027355C20|nr:hypothetical protein [Thalassospira sp.]MDP2700368.1 hypothetical protein [Thalassospira sp.]
MKSNAARKGRRKSLSGIMSEILGAQIYGGVMVSGLLRERWRTGACQREMTLAYKIGLSGTGRAKDRLLAPKHNISRGQIKCAGLQTIRAKRTAAVLLRVAENSLRIDKDFCRFAIGRADDDFGKGR